jgi:hypothetical protein
MRGRGDIRFFCEKKHYPLVDNVLVLHFNPWVEDSAGGLLVPEGLYSPVAKYMCTSVLVFKYEYELNCQEKQYIL